MYPRLFLARSLLRDDGVIFVSIDDNEVHHLRMIMDEIFGEENFVDMLIWRKKSGGGQDDIYFAKEHEYILTYRKTQNFQLNEQTFIEDENEFPYLDKLGKYKLIKLEKWGAGSYRKDAPSLYYPIKDPDGNDYYPKAPDGRDGRWRKKPEYVISENKLEWKKTNKGWTPYEKIYYDPTKEKTKKVRTILYDIAENTDGTNELKEIFGRKDIFSNPKPSLLIKYLIKLTTSSDSFILDFFAGSGTTGHAVWDLNKEDGGNRKFILVQLDEEVQDEEIKKEFSTVADICIERLKRVSEEYKKENNGQDFGFKVFRLGKSNYNLKDEFEFDPSEDKEELKEKYLEWLGVFVNQPLVSGWKEIDVIYEVMLKEGLNLNSKIEKVKIKEDEFYYIKDEGQNLDFYISFKDKFNQDTIEEIRTSKYKGKMFVFLDNALTDSDKINLSAFVRLKVI
jgi:adenine-specific DNA-methyltransferase